MAQSPGQQRAADAVADELAERGWTNKDLSDATKEADPDNSPVDPGTIGDFLAYRRWPKIGTLGRFEKVFGWPTGSLRKLAMHGTPIVPLQSSDPETVTPVKNAGLSGWLTRVSNELTAEEQERLWDKYGHLFEVMVREANAENPGSDRNTRPGTT